MKETKKRIEALIDKAGKNDLTPDERLLIIAQRTEKYARSQLESYEALKPQKPRNQKYSLSIDQLAPTTLRDDLRLELFRTIKRKRPQVVYSLAKDVLLRYKRYVEMYGVFPVIWGHLQIPHNDKDLDNVRRDNAHCILKWSSSHNLAWIQRNTLIGGVSLVNEFCLDQVLETLNAWCWHGVTAEPDWAYTLNHKKYQSFQVQYYSSSQAFRFEYSPWPVEADSWESYERKLDEAYNAEKQIYRMIRRESNSIIKDLAPPAINKRNPAHFDWLVDYQMGELTFAEIAKMYGGSSQNLSDRSVSEAVKGLAAILGFTIRLPKRGRPTSKK